MLAILILVPGLANRMDMSFTEMGTDCYTGGGADCGRAPFMAFYTQDLQGSQTLIGYMWNILYNGLNACNAAIARADGAGLSDDLKKQRLAKYISQGIVSAPDSRDLGRCSPLY